MLRRIETDGLDETAAKECAAGLAHWFWKDPVRLKAGVFESADRAIRAAIEGQADFIVEHLEDCIAANQFKWE